MTVRIGSHDVTCPLRIDGLAFQIIARHEGWGTTALRVTLRVPHSTTGKPIDVSMECDLADELLTSHHLGHAVRRLVLDALAHELDEQLRVDGVRVVEPHAMESPVTKLERALDRSVPFPGDDEDT